MMAFYICELPKLIEICCSHGGDYGEYDLLGCTQYSVVEVY